MKNQMQTESGEHIVFSRYITINGRRIYPKRAKVFAFPATTKR